MHRVAAPTTALSRREPPATQSAVLKAFQPYGGAYSFEGFAESHPIPPPSGMVRRSLLFQVWLHPVTWSTLNLWLALNWVILVWWLCIRLMSVLTPGLQSGLLLIPTFILHSQVRCHHGATFPFLNQTVADFEQGLDSILADSIETPELNTFLDEPDAVTSSVSSWFSTWFVLFLILLNHSLPLGYGFVNCGARLGCFLQLCLWLPRCWHLN